MYKLVYDVQKGVGRFPTVTLSMLALFYVIGAFLFDGSQFSDPKTYRMDTWIVEWPDTPDRFTLQGKLEWQWQVFTYYLIHFALVHYGYSGFLMIFYVSGLEKATNGKVVVFTFLTTSILAPIVLSPLLFFVIDPMTQNLSFGVLRQSYYLGSSVGVWGCIGMTVTISRKRRLYWVPIFVLLFLEFFLKIAVLSYSDITANIVHVIVFGVAFVVSKIFFRFDNSEGKAGEIRIGRDRFLSVLLAIHALIMVVHFVDTLNLLGTNLADIIL